MNLFAAAIAAVLLLAAPAAVAQGKSFVDADLTGRDMSGQNLAGANFTGATLTNANFRGSNLRGAIFKEALLRNANFSRVDCTGCDFRGAIMPFNQQSTPDVQGGSSIFANANFEGVDLKGQSFYGATLTGANLRNTTGMGSVIWARLRGADLSGASLMSAQVGGDARVFAGATYDKDTAWPSSVDPEQAGAKMK
jgi:uncharacterized protein YjbI with pentapeptide repeats